MLANSVSFHLHIQDPKRTKVLPSYNNIADGAQVILDNCKRTQRGVRGKLGHDDLWTVIIDRDTC
ncbi:hypothetical protein BJX62DRAFT_212342 [Aspergillus germanicus]